MRFTPEQRDYLAQSTTQLNYFLRLVRRDGLTLGLTDHPIHYDYDGVSYKSDSGYEFSSQQANDSMGVNTVDLFSALAEITGEISRGDVVNGLYDGADCYLFMLALDRPELGEFKLARYYFGRVTIEDRAFKAELQSLVSALQQDVSPVIAVSCIHALGDAFGLDGVAGCKYDLPANTITSTITTATSSTVFEDAARTEPADYFGAGVLTFTTGNNAGFSRDVKSFEAPEIEVFEPFPYTVAIGDTYTMTPGCRRRLIEDCRDKFSQVDNYGGVGVYSPNSNTGNRFGGQ